MQSKLQIRKALRGALALALAVSAIPSEAPAVTLTATQSLTATLSPIGKVSVASTATLTTTGSLVPYTLALPVNFRVRTTPGGSGSITVQGTSNFTPAGGPLISAGNLTYTCSGATLGTACAGTQTISLGSATPVLTIPASACTGGG